MSRTYYRFEVGTITSIVIFGIVLTGLFFIVMAVLVVRNKDEMVDGGDNVIKNIYVYLVLFATLMMTIGGTVSAFMAIADMVAPTPYYSSFEEFKINNGEIKREIGPDDNAVKLTEAELQDRYDAVVVSEQERQMARAQNSLIKSMGWIIIPLPIFLFFQRRLTKKDA